MAHLSQLALRGTGTAAVRVEGSPNTSMSILYHAPQPCVQAAAFDGGAADGVPVRSFAVLNICNATVRAAVAGAAPALRGLNVTAYSALDAGGWAPLPPPGAGLPWASGPLSPEHTAMVGPTPLEWDVPGLSMVLVEALG
jgi:hypothetical protein